MASAATEKVHTITSLGSTNEVVLPPTRRGRIAMLSEDEARELTTTIQRLQVQAWFLLGEAHDRQAWAALGYETWKDYVTVELQMSEARSYQLLDQAKVMRAIASVDGVEIDAIDAPPARVVAKVKDDLAGVKRVVKTALRHDSSIDEAIRDLAKKKTALASSGPTTPALVAAPVQVAPQSKVECPACHGRGTVTAKRAEALEAVL